MLGHVTHLLTAINWLLLQLICITWAFITIIVILLYGLYMFLKALAYDLYSKQKRTGTVADKDDHIFGVCDNDVAPIVLVHGLFGFGEGKMGGMPYFGGIENTHGRIFSPDLGSLTSLYDRARQLFYYLKGGRVDYGEEHSKAYGHSQFGRVYEQGKYLQWDEDNPIHFVCHSAGAQVIRILQQMLADKAFKGYEKSNAKWIASITTLSGALNGSTLGYIYGMRTDDWRFAQTMSPLGLFCVVVTIYDWLDIPFLKKYYNFGFDHFHMSRKNTGFRGLVECLNRHIGPFGSDDWVVPNLTIQGSREINKQLHTFPDTYYFSYATKAVEGSKRMKSSIGLLSHCLQSLWISKWHYPTNVQPPYIDYKDEDWWDNDGQLNTISMTHPHLPVEHPHCFVSNGFRLEPRPGVWYCETIEAYHDQFVLSIEPNGRIFQLYDAIFRRCRSLNTKRS